MLKGDRFKSEFVIQCRNRFVLPAAIDEDDAEINHAWKNVRNVYPNLDKDVLDKRKIESRK